MDKPAAMPVALAISGHNKENQPTEQTAVKNIFVMKSTDKNNNGIVFKPIAGISGKLNNCIQATQL